MSAPGEPEQPESAGGWLVEGVRLENLAGPEAVIASTVALQTRRELGGRRALDYVDDFADVLQARVSSFVNATQDDEPNERKVFDALIQLAATSAAAARCLLGDLAFEAPDTPSMEQN